MKSGFAIRVIFPMIFLSAGFVCHAQIDLQKLEPVILDTVGPAIFQYWEFQDTPELWDIRSTELPGLTSYRDSLVRVMGEKRFSMILRKRHQITQDRSELDTVTNGDRKNALLVLTDSLARLRKINQLEAQILNYQLSRYPLFSHPTEFHAFFLKNDRLDRIRVYFASSDTPWPPKPGVIIDAVERDIHGDWRLIGHLHNHYEGPDNDYIGILAPSLSDAQYFKVIRERFGLEKAFVTNGFHTVVLDGTIFPFFESY